MHVCIINCISTDAEICIQATNYVSKQTPKASNDQTIMSHPSLIT